MVSDFVIPFPGGVEGILMVELTDVAREKLEKFMVDKNPGEVLRVYMAYG